MVELGEPRRAGSLGGLANIGAFAQRVGGRPAVQAALKAEGLVKIAGRGGRVAAAAPRAARRAAAVPLESRALAAGPPRSAAVARPPSSTSFGYRSPFSRGTSKGSHARSRAVGMAAGMLCAAAAAWAQADRGAARSGREVRAHGPRRDSARDRRRLDDAVWATAALVDDLHQTTPVEYARARRAHGNTAPLRRRRAVRRGAALRHRSVEHHGAQHAAERQRSARTTAST